MDMSESLSARRMGRGKADISQFQLEPWIDLPESVLWKLPELRDWQNRMRLREEANQDTLNQLARLMQNSKEE